MIEPLDYEISHEYYVTIEATDGGSPPLSDMATVNINLTDVNDNKPVFSQDIYTAVVSEDAELGRTVLMVRDWWKNMHSISKDRFTYSRRSCVAIKHNYSKAAWRVKVIFLLSR